MQEELLKRLKSFLWRVGCIAAIAGLSWAAQNINLLELPVWVQTLLGLALAEGTKWLNNNTRMFGKSLK